MIFGMILAIILLLVGNAFAFKVSWDPNLEHVDGYRIYYSPNLEEVESKTAPFVEVDGSKSSACIDLGINEYSINGFFAGAIAYEGSIESDMSNIVYHLYGNIYGNDWDGVSHLDARVDGLDLNIIGFYFNQSVTHQEIDCNQNFALENPDLRQRADLHRDANNRIDGYDFIKWYFRRGNKMPP